MTTPRHVPPFVAGLSQPSGWVSLFADMTAVYFFACDLSFRRVTRKVAPGARGTK